MTEHGITELNLRQADAYCRAAAALREVLAVDGGENAISPADRGWACTLSELADIFEIRAGRDFYKARQ
mgnify:FL=1